MAWIQTMSGRVFNFNNPTVDDVYVPDIIHALSNLCRFTGHTKEFYSVAQHSCLVSDILPQSLKVHGLFHDAQEAYVGDVSSPLKRILKEDKTYTDIEDNIQSIIFQCLRLHTLSEKDQKSIKKADLTLLLTERRDLMIDTVSEKSLIHFGYKLWEVDRVSDLVPLSEKITPWSPERAREEFQNRYAILTMNKPPPITLNTCSLCIEGTRKESFNKRTIHILPNNDEVYCSNE